MLKPACSYLKPFLNSLLAVWLCRGVVREAQYTPPLILSHQFGCETLLLTAHCTHQKGEIDWQQVKLKAK